jgi:hypothetical protein
MTDKELVKTYRAMCKKLKVKSFYPFWFDKSYLKMKLIKGVKVNV